MDVQPGRAVRPQTNTYRQLNRYITSTTLFCAIHGGACLATGAWAQENANPSQTPGQTNQSTFANNPEVDTNPNAAPPQYPKAAPPDARGDRRRRAAERQEQLEADMRRMMNEFGCTDTAVQAAVIAHIRNETRARRPLLSQSRSLAHALRDPDVPDDKMTTLILNFRTAQGAERQRREASQTALDAQVRYSSNPRLEAMLLLFGVIGDGPFFIPMGGPVMGGPGPRFDGRNNNSNAPDATNATGQLGISQQNAPQQNSAQNNAATLPAVGLEAEKAGPNKEESNERGADDQGGLRNRNDDEEPGGKREGKRSREKAEEQEANAAPETTTKEESTGSGRANKARDKAGKEGDAAPEAKSQEGGKAAE